jgi:hypothetical protein
VEERLDALVLEQAICQECGDGHEEELRILYQDE